MNDQEIFEGLFLRGYEEGLVHGFTLGRGKQPRPEDTKVMEDMFAVMQKRIKADFERQKNAESKG